MDIEDQKDKLPTYGFVQDNPSVQTAKIFHKFFDENYVNVLRWPSKSPDINIIENVWSYIKDELYQIKDELTCEEDTWVKARQIWDSIPMTYIRDLYNDLPIRMDELKNMKGGPINH